MALTDNTLDWKIADTDHLGTSFAACSIDESLKITSKNFDSSLFLRTVHANTSYADLERGMRHLESSINERTDTLRAMVKNDFDRFVNAKSSIDGRSLLDVIWQQFNEEHHHLTGFRCFGSAKQRFADR